MWYRHWCLLTHVVVYSCERLMKKTLPNSSVSSCDDSELNLKVLGSISAKTHIILRGVFSSFPQLLPSVGISLYTMAGLIQILTKEKPESVPLSNTNR
jgi:hypothetical protein